MSSAVDPWVSKLFSQATSQPHLTVCDLIEEITELLGNEVIQKQPKASHVLNNFLDAISDLDGLERLNVKQKRFYETCPKLLNQQGGYNASCVGRLKQISKLPEILDVPVPEDAFGKAVWTKYFGSIGEEPPLPSNIHQILDGCCPFWPGKKVRETHMLILIPSTINDHSLTINHLEKIVRHPKGGGYSTEMVRYPRQVGNMCAPHNYWILITKDVIPDSLGKSYEQQCQIIRSYSQYKLPRLVEITISMLLAYIKTGQSLFGSDQSKASCFEMPRFSLVPGFVGIHNQEGLHCRYQSQDEKRQGASNLGMCGVLKCV